MIEEGKMLKELQWLDKEIDGMMYPTKTAFKRAIKEFEKRLVRHDEEISIPEWIRMNREVEK